ncbi:MAG: glycerate kinase [Actinomycetes bacterium]
MPHVLVAPDKFKGTLTAADVAASVAAGMISVRPGLDVVRMPVADGGDGTLAAAVAAGFTLVPMVASGPTGEPVDTAYARRGEEAVVELAEVSGLGQLPGGKLEPLRASSRGTGDLIRGALDAGCRRVVLAIGGSACTDGGSGLLSALGARVLDASGRPLPDGGGTLVNAARLDLSGLHPAVGETRFVVASDVDNPLLGQRGAAAVYGPQKGANDQDLVVLENGLSRWAQVVTEATGEDKSADAGAGAAGGVGYAALAVLGAELRPGIELVLDLVGFASALEGAQLVVTGEGSLDEQTLHGKAPAGVAAAATAQGVPVVAVAGRAELTSEQLRAAGFTAAYPLTDESDDLDECMTRPGPLLERIGARIAREHLQQAG